LAFGSKETSSQWLAWTHVPGYREISTVCTHPDHQGKGYAGLLVSSLANEIWQTGEIPFLHVLSDNTRAQRLYEKLHFHKRCELQLRLMTRQS